MTSPRHKLLLCNCNKTMPLDGKALGAALGLETVPDINSELCRRHVTAFEAAAKSGDDLLVACTQEAPLFLELIEEFKSAGDVRFVNIRETAGWSAQSSQATPKIAALIAAAQLPELEPVPVVSYKSNGELLIIGPGGAAIAWADKLTEQFGVHVLITDSTDCELPTERCYPVSSGKVQSLNGYLGAFDVIWDQVNPIDLDTCTRCNACITACPEHAIDYSYQIDLDKCKAHRACVKACGEIHAIDFGRGETTRNERFDLVLDLGATPLLRMHQLPQGYFAPGRDPFEQALAARVLTQMTGEFEKPKYFAYNERICAHSRAEITGCNKCIDICSTAAISADGEHVKVEPHLCMGCGACASVCPSGAMSYAYPRVADAGLRVRTLLTTYQQAGGKKASLLLHNATNGSELLVKLGRRGRGLPSNLIPLEVFHVASLGIDTMLGAIAYGAVGVTILSAGGEAPEYLDSLKREMNYAQQILSALGYGDSHFRLIEAHDHTALEAAVWAVQPATTAPATALFNWSNEKRNTLNFIFTHLLKHAPQPQEQIALAAGAPYGKVNVNTQACTLCMACVGACPEGALLDSQERPQLRFIESNCVQCGLCEKTCPENAISLTPRLSLNEQAKSQVVLHEAEIFACIKCGKAFATKQMIDNMLARLTSHSMFAEAGALERLKMCSDCRVIDLMRNAKHGSILDQ